MSEATERKTEKNKNEKEKKKNGNKQQKNALTHIEGRLDDNFTRKKRHDSLTTLNLLNAHKASAGNSNKVNKKTKEGAASVGASNRTA